LSVIAERPDKIKEWCPVEKSKFGFSAAVYPLLITLCVLFSTSFNSFIILAGFIVLGFVMLTEKNEKITKATLHALLYLFVWPMYNLVTGQFTRFYVWSSGKLVELIESWKFYEFILNTRNAFDAFGSLLTFAFLTIVVIFGVCPLLAGKESKLPGKKLVDKFFD
jgi:hypothetical protein